MIRLSRQNTITGAIVLLTLAFMVIGASITHVGPRAIVVWLLSVLLAVALILGYIRFRPQVGKQSRIPLMAGMIFLAGALYGLVQSLKEGWQWIDLVSLIIPLVLGSYLIWFGFRKLSKAPRPGQTLRD